MSNKIFSQENHVVQGLVPVADCFAGTVTSDVIDLSNAHAVTFLVIRGAGVGASTITIEACDDTTPSNTTAVAFAYRLNSTTATDTYGALTWATTSGIGTGITANVIHQFHVDADMLANSGYRYVRLKAVETTASAVTGCVVAILHNMRYPRAVTTSQID